MRNTQNYFTVFTEGVTPTEVGGVITLSPKHTFKSSELSEAVLVAPNTGFAGASVATFSGTYAVGDQVRVTVTLPSRSSQLLVKSYTHTVVSGAITVTDVAAAFAASITADINAGLNEYLASATNVAGVLTITQAGDDKRALTTVAYTDSALGAVAVVNTPTTISEGQPSDLVDYGIDSSLINLAQYDTVKIKLSAEAAIPFVDSKGATVKELIWFGTVGEGAGLVTLVNT